MHRGPVACALSSGCTLEHPGQSMHKLTPSAGNWTSACVCLGGEHRPATSIDNTARNVPCSVSCQASRADVERAPSCGNLTTLQAAVEPVSYTHLRAHETSAHL
eukprot:2480003-Alexandrium_andersonii.AAC.1